MNHEVNTISNLHNPIGQAFKNSIPIFCSFIPLGFGFGYISQQLGIPWHLVIVMALLIYAGSVEFLLITMFAKSVAMSDIIIAAALVNLRHIFYGISVQQHYPNNFIKRLYMIHALTDETYSLLAAKKSVDTRFSFWLSLFNHMYWVIGVTLGVTIGHYSTFKLKGLEFCLTALFIVLTIEQAYRVKKYFPFVLAIIATVFAKFFFPNQMLCIAMIVVTLLLTMNQKWNKHSDEYI